MKVLSVEHRGEVPDEIILMTVKRWWRTRKYVYIVHHWYDFDSGKHINTSMFNPLLLGALLEFERKQAEPEIVRLAKKVFSDKM